MKLERSLVCFPALEFAWDHLKELPMGSIGTDGIEKLQMADRKHRFFCVQTRDHSRNQVPSFVTQSPNNPRK